MRPRPAAARHATLVPGVVPSSGRPSLTDCAPGQVLLGPTWTAPHNLHPDALEPQPRGTDEFQPFVTGHSGLQISLGGAGA